jgi:hypothetical protein
MAHPAAERGGLDIFDLVIVDRRSAACPSCRRKSGIRIADGRRFPGKSQCVSEESEAGASSAHGSALA